MTNVPNIKVPANLAFPVLVAGNIIIKVPFEGDILDLGNMFLRVVRKDWTNNPKPVDIYTLERLDNLTYIENLAKQRKLI